MRCSGRTTGLPFIFDRFRIPESLQFDTILNQRFVNVERLNKLGDGKNALQSSLVLYSTVSVWLCIRLGSGTARDQLGKYCRSKTQDTTGVSFQERADLFIVR